MPKYHAVYRVQVYSEWNIPPHYYDREPGIGEELSISFAAELGNLSDSQLDSVIGQVKYNSVQISQSTDQPPHQLDFGVVHLIRDGIFDGFSAADQVRINRMVKIYSRANDDTGFNIDLFKPLALCVKYARLFKKLKPDSTPAQDGKRKRAKRKNSAEVRLLVYASETELIEKIKKKEVTVTSDDLAEKVAKFDGGKPLSSSAVRKTPMWRMIGILQKKPEDLHWDDMEDMDQKKQEYKIAKARYKEEKDIRDAAIDRE